MLTIRPFSHRMVNPRLNHHASIRALGYSAFFLSKSNTCAGR